MVRWQASGSRCAARRVKLDAESLFSSLEPRATGSGAVGEDLGALNRLAVSHAASAKSAWVISSWPTALCMAKRLKPILHMGQEAGLATFDDIDGAFRTFSGSSSGTFTNTVAAWRPSGTD